MNDEPRVLIIDDEPAIRGFASQVLREDGWDISEAASAEQAFAMMGSQNWAMVLCDVGLGGENGYQVLHRFKKESPATQVILMTGQGSAVGALDATSFGAYDYLLKPFGVEALLSLSSAIREQIALLPILSRVIHNRPAQVYTSDIQLVGRSETFIEVMKLVGRVAGTDLPVLVTGESGTGKEVIASALHVRSNRSKGPFVAVNCGALSAELVESELFGHVRGAFTGADRDRGGLWEQAHGGTLFLDEITETSPSFQVKLLRALQHGEIRRVGATESKRFDVRVIAASNRNVVLEVEAGRFRQDLFYRLNVVNIHLPPLRERQEDIFPLANSFAERVWSLNPSARFSAEALVLLEQYPWPGNIRELENAVVRAVALCSIEVRPIDLPEHIRNFQPGGKDGMGVTPLSDPQLSSARHWPSLTEMEAEYVRSVLNHTKGNKQAAVRMLKVDRKKIERMIVRYDIKVEPATKAG